MILTSYNLRSGFIHGSHKVETVNCLAKLDFNGYKLDKTIGKRYRTAYKIIYIFINAPDPKTP